MGILQSRQKKSKPGPTLQQPVSISQKMSSRAEVKTQDGGTIKTSTREESKTMSYEENSASRGPDKHRCGHVCEKKVSHAVVEKSESAKSAETKTIIKDGVKTVMRFENGRLVAHCVDDVPMKLPDEKDKDSGKDKIEVEEKRNPEPFVASGQTAAGEFPSFPPASFPTIPPPSFPVVPPPCYPEMPEEFYPEYPSLSYPVVPPPSFPTVPPASFPSVPPDMPLENLTAEEKKVLKRK